MSKSSLFRTKSGDGTEKSGEISNDKRLEAIHQLIENFAYNSLKPKIDDLYETIDQNINLVEDIEDKQQNRLKTIISKSNLSIDNKASNELSETDLNNEFNALNTSLESLSCELRDKKQHKTQLSNKTKTLTKHLDEMENRVKDLKQHNKSDDTNEYLTLASVMRVMYKTWNNSKVIGLLFNDNKEKSLERLIVIDAQNKGEQQMAQQFWESLEKDYKIN